MNMSTPVTVDPMDQFNQELVANVHPPDWANPAPAERYNLVVVGGGPAGLVAALGAAGLGAKVALVEKHLIGGDCLNLGCVPSKSMIRSARAAAEIVRAGGLGIRVPEGVQVDFPAVMERVRRLRAKVSHHDSAARLRDDGMDVFLGEGRFTSGDTFTVGEAKLRFSKAVIATGARAWLPPLEGLHEAGFLTNETVFTITVQPKRLAVFGAGPIGCELAQVFQRLGTQVHILNRSERMLPREDPEAAALLYEIFQNEGIDVRLAAEVTRITTSDQGKHVHFRAQGQDACVVVDEILVGAGRRPNVNGLGLETVGVEYDEVRGVKVDDRLRTTNPRIYAVGDVCMKHKFTHAADAAARIVIQNALFWGRKKLSALTMPWCTYTEPEIAHVGLHEHEAQEQGIETETFRKDMADVDRAICDGEERGFVKVLVKKGTGRILGATIVATHAGEIINEVSLAIVHGIGLGSIGNLIHPYPTQAAGIKQAAGAYTRTRLTPMLKKVFNKLMAWQR